MTEGVGASSGDAMEAYMRRTGLVVVCILACLATVRMGSTSAAGLVPNTPGAITKVWANDGGDKVWRSELRATASVTAVLNSVWNGASIALFGARNEVVGFNLVLEAPVTAAKGVSMTLTQLSGPAGALITTTPASGNGVFNYVGRNIELFYVRYLEIKGISSDLAFDHYDERHIPIRCRTPWTGEGAGTYTWTDRPCHNQFMPDIAVPIELAQPFTITAGTNQSIWGDIYIPKTAPAGIYTGTVTVRENGAITWQVPISLWVRRFQLPDVPNSRTMLFFSSENINDRYLGNQYPNPGTALYIQSLQLADEHMQLAHRHKISLIDSYIPPEQMDESWTARLDGSLFTPAHGYSGVGVGTGNNVYSIGTYGGWPWQGGTESEMRSNTNAWVNWFDAHPFSTPTEYFLYLIDESSNYPQTQQWAQWIHNNPGAGKRLKSFATINVTAAVSQTPALDIAASSLGVGITSQWQNAANTYLADPSKRFYMYNGSRPATGSFATEDDGTALREKAWGQYKKGIQRWFYWESTYYDNFQGTTGQTNVFAKAQTFGNCCATSASLGENGNNYTNGDGVLFYPGTDTRYPASTYGVFGPFASLRMKQWRRGIQDVDYLTLAAQISPTQVSAIVNAMVPKVLWEYGVTDINDPTWVLTDISWPVNPDAWEAARDQLADIIETITPRVFLPLVIR